MSEITSDHKFKIKAQDYLLLRQQVSAKPYAHTHVVCNREDMHDAGCSESMSRFCIGVLLLNQCQGHVNRRRIEHKSSSKKRTYLRFTIELDIVARTYSLLDLVSQPTVQFMSSESSPAVLRGRVVSIRRA